MPLAHVQDDLELVGAVDVAGGVVRAVEHDGPCLAGDPLLYHAQRRKGEVVLQQAGDGYDADVGHPCEGVHVRVVGLRDDHLVARVAQRHEREQDRLRSAGGDQHVVGGDVHTDTFAVVPDHSLAQLEVSVALAVCDDLVRVVVDSLERLLRALDVGLSDIEVVDLDPPGLGRPGIRAESSDRGSLETAYSFRNILIHLVGNYEALPQSEFICLIFVDATSRNVTKRRQPIHKDRCL